MTIIFFLFLSVYVSWQLFRIHKAELLWDTNTKSNTIQSPIYLYYFLWTNKSIYNYKLYRTVAKWNGVHLFIYYCTHKHWFISENFRRIKTEINFYDKNNHLLLSLYIGTHSYIWPRNDTSVIVLVCLTQFSLPFNPGCGHFPIFQMVSY